MKNNKKMKKQYYYFMVPIVLLSLAHLVLCYVFTKKPGISGILLSVATAICFFEFILVEKYYKINIFDKFYCNKASKIVFLAVTVILILVLGTFEVLKLNYSNYYYQLFMTPICLFFIVQSLYPVDLKANEADGDSNDTSSLKSEQK